MLRSKQGTLSIDVAPSGFTLDAISAAAEDEMTHQEAGPRYRADITAGSLKVTESRRIADLLLHDVNANDWTDAIVKQNILQARTPATARRLARLIRSRLESMGPDLWKLVRDGKGSVATHAVFAAAVKQSPLLGDFHALRKKIYASMGELWQRISSLGGRCFSAQSKNSERGPNAQ